MIMRFKKLYESIQTPGEMFLVLVSCSIADSPSAKQGKSVGSTYIIDLKNNISYRFYGHDKLMSGCPLTFFINTNTGEVYQNPDFKTLSKSLKKWHIREATKGKEPHDSTEIVAMTIIPNVVGASCVREKNLSALRQWESFLIRGGAGKVIVPPPGKPAIFK